MSELKTNKLSYEDGYIKGYEEGIEEGYSRGLYGGIQEGKDMERDRFAYDAYEVMAVLLDSAKEYFRNYPSDFCVQVDNFPDRMVFGGTNRVTWTMRNGFSIDPSYCTEKFKQDNKELLKAKGEIK